MATTETSDAYLQSINENQEMSGPRSPGYPSPLPIKLGTSSIDLINHLIALTTKVNQLDERVCEVESAMVRVAGETSRSNQMVVEQINTLTEAVRQLRDVVVPSGHREDLITLPEIVVDQVNEYMNAHELEQRRKDSMRAKAAKDEEDKLEAEDKLARARDLRNAKIGFWIAVGSGILIELGRILITHSF